MSEQIRSQGNESDIWKRWRDWKIRHPWIEYVRYPLWVSIACVPLIYFIHHIYFSPTEISNTRYLLSALVQCEAAIVAIVITLTMFAIQLTYSEYSPRVIKILIKNRDMMILLGLYGISIFYGLFVLRTVEAAEGSIVRWGYSHILFIMPSEYISHEFELLVSIALLLGIFSIVALIPYIQNTIKLLNPKAIIVKQLESLPITELLTEDDTKKEKYRELLQVVFDIIHGSIRKSDLETTKEGLEALTSRIIQQLDDINSSNEKKISEIFCEHLKVIAELAKSKRDEVSVIEVIKNLKDFGKKSAEKELVNATKEVASSLGTVGEAAAENEFKNAAKQVALSLEDIGVKENNRLYKLNVNFEKAIEQVAKSLGDVGEAAAENELKIVTKQVALSLKNIGMDSIKNNFKKAIEQVAESLGTVGEVAAENELKNATKEVATSLGTVGEDAGKKGKELEDAVLKVAKSLGDVGEAAAKKYLKNATWQAVESLEEVVKTAAKGNLKEAVKEVAKSLGSVGKTSIENRLLDTTRRTIESLVAIWKFKEPQAEESLNAIGKTAVENGLQDTVKYAIVSLEAVAKATADKDLAKDAANFLGTLGVDAAKKGKDLKVVVMEALWSLRAIGEEAIAKKGWDDVVSKSIISLFDVGKEAANKGRDLESAVIRSAWCLKDIGEAIGKTTNVVASNREVERVADALREIEQIAVDKGKDEVSKALGVIEQMIKDSKSST